MDTDGAAFEQSGAWSVTGVAGWGRVRLRAARALELLPGVGVGVASTRFRSPRAMPGGHAIDSSSTALALDAELGARWTAGRFGAGLRAGLTVIPATQTLSDRNRAVTVEAHVEPWLLATASAGF